MLKVSKKKKRNNEKEKKKKIICEFWYKILLSVYRLFSPLVSSSVSVLCSLVRFFRFTFFLVFCVLFFFFPSFLFLQQKSKERKDTSNLIYINGGNLTIFCIKCVSLSLSLFFFHHLDLLIHSFSRLGYFASCILKDRTK